MDRYNAEQQRKNFSTIAGGLRTYVKDGELKCELIPFVDYFACFRCKKELLKDEIDYCKECEDKI